MVSERVKEWGISIEKYFEGYLALLILVAYAIIIMYDVTRRFLFDSQTLWGFTMVLGLFSWVSWLSAALAIRTESHFRFTLVRNGISNRSNYILRCLDVVLWVIIIGSVFYFSLSQLETRIASNVVVTGTDFPRYLLYASVPIGTGLMIIRSIQQFIIVTRRYRNGEEVAPTAEI